MSLILPKGFVVNSPEIEGSIERINAEPLDLAEIANFWKVYTTTKRRLLDPTAERLENYWWRIWGSRRRELKGAIVARLFAYISDGQSFVPLRGPANRDEGIPSLNRTTCHESGAASAVTLHRPSQSRPSTTSSSTASKVPVVVTPHPILKKTRGPSTTGPRPIAHFILPHESGAETDTNSSTGLQSPNLLVVQPPSPNFQSSGTDKKAVAARGSKKEGQFVASTAAKRKKPVIVRRQSSQSSTDMAAKIDAQNSNQSSAERIPPTFSEAPQSPRKPKSADSPTLADTMGQLDLGDTTSATLPQVTNAKGRNSEDVKRIEVFAKRPVPPISGIAAAHSPEGSLAGSKSQLTLLLEKDRARSA